jgi:hypothetical protein
MIADDLRQLGFAEALVLDGSGQLDFDGTIARLRETARYAEERADNNRHYARQLVNVSFFEYEDARDEAREWQCRAIDAWGAMAMLERMRSELHL